MKLGIIPFRDFWIDCYSTAIYSIYMSLCHGKQEVVYSNEYLYEYSKIDLDNGRKFWSIEPKLNVDKISNAILKNREQVCFSNGRENIIQKLENFLEAGKIVFLGVDLFYWIEDNYHWHRNHINHSAIINGFDHSQKMFFVLETGAKGYKEYAISYDELCLAANSFSEEFSLIYDANTCIHIEPDMVEDIKRNAVGVLKSIDNLLNSRNVNVKLLDFCELQRDEVAYVFDHIQTHVYSMESRAKANKFLIEKTGNLNDRNLLKMFQNIEIMFGDLKNTILKENMKREYRKDLEWFKKQIIYILKEERKAWEYLLDNNRNIIDKIN